MDRLQKASSFFVFTIESNTLSVRILAALQHNDNPQSISFVLVLQNFQDSTFASVNNTANTQMCYVCSCVRFVSTLVDSG